MALANYQPNQWEVESVSDLKPPVSSQDSWDVAGEQDIETFLTNKAMAPQRAFDRLQSTAGFPEGVTDTSVQNVAKEEPVQASTGIGKEFAKLVPYLAIEGVRGVTSILNPILGPAGTTKLLEDAAKYWKPNFGKIPDITYDFDKKGKFELKKTEADLTDILGATASGIGAVLGPVRAAMTAGNLVANLPVIEKAARPFYRSVLAGMTGGALLGEGKLDETLSNAALFGFFEALPYTTQIPRTIKNSSAWRMATIKERGLMLQSLDDVMAKNPGMREVEVLRTWNNPTWREEALQRRVQGEEAPPITPEPPPVQPTGPEPPIQPSGPTPDGTHQFREYAVPDNVLDSIQTAEQGQLLKTKLNSQGLHDPALDVVIAKLTPIGPPPIGPLADDFINHIVNVGTTGDDYYAKKAILQAHPGINEDQINKLIIDAQAKKPIGTSVAGPGTVETIIPPAPAAVLPPPLPEGAPGTVSPATTPFLPEPGVPSPIYRQGNPEGKWWSSDKEYAATFGKQGKKVVAKNLPEDLKIIPEEELLKAIPETERKLLDGSSNDSLIYDKTLDSLGVDGFSRLEDRMTGPSTTSYYIKSPEVLKEYGLEAPPPKPKKPFEAKTLLSWVKSQGGIWDESLPGETNQFIGRESGVIGLLSKKSGKTFDELAEMAKDYGWIGPDATAKDFIDLLNKDVAASKQGKERVKNFQQDIDKGILKEITRDEMAQGEWADTLTKEGWKVYGPREEMAVGDIEPGDRLLIQGEEYTHVGFDKEGLAIIKDGQTFRVDVFDKLPVEALKEKGKKVAKVELEEEKEPESLDLFKESLKREAPDITYEEFEKQYQDAFDHMKKYTPKQVGMNHYADQMAKLADDYPEYLEKFEAKIDAEAAKPVFGKLKPKQPYQDKLDFSGQQGIEFGKVGEEPTQKEPAREAAIGVVSGGIVDRIEAAGLEFTWGGSADDAIGPVSGGYADRLKAAGIGVRKVVKAAPSSTVADWVKSTLETGKPFTKQELFDQADTSFGGTMAEGKYSGKDAFDALEMGINRFILSQEGIDPSTDSYFALSVIDGIRQNIIDKIPSQSGLRSEEQDEFQQFSTPPDLAFTMAWAANLNKSDVVLEPSAGIGGIAVFAKNAGAKTIVNELSPRRAALLEKMGFDRVFTENAEQLNNILPADVKPTVVLMNPPFSATAGRIQGQRSSSNVVTHLDQAFKRLQPGGRLVALVGKGWFPDPKVLSNYLTNIVDNYNLRANIIVSGKGYAKYGTTYDNRILVFDKTAPDGKPTVKGQVEDVKDAIPLLQEVRNARTTLSEQPANQPSGERGIVAGEGQPGPGRPISSSTGEIRPGKREGEAGSEGARPVNIQGIPGQPGGVVSEEGVKTPGGPGRPGAPQKSEPSQPGAVLPGGVGPETFSQKPELPEVKPSELKVESKISEKPEGELTDSVYESYRPKRLKVEGAKAHPAKLVESAAMSVVDPPSPTYQPNLPKNIITSGKLSDVQVEAVVYAGQSHEEILPSGERRAFMIGDGTGVGKGREIAAILLDNWNQGRKKSIWVSKDKSLFRDAQRDVKGIGWNEKLLFEHGKIKADAEIKVSQGVLYTTYDTIKSGANKKKEGKIEKSRLDQIVEWLGKDFDGVIAFDESHNMGNAIAVRGERGTSQPSQRALSGIDLQNKLPNARIVYVSATGATEVINLAYAPRLGLWGKGTPFATVEQFISQVQSGGLASMELVARDMKAMGAYMSRKLSFDDVTYNKIEHILTPEQRIIYDDLATAWQGVLRDVHTALGVTGANLNSRRKSAAMSAFWGSHQRFFNQVLTSMQMPSAIADMQSQIAKDNAVIIQLVNTNEANQERQLSRMEEGDDLEDLDLTPRDQLMEYIKNSFPVQQYEEYTDENGNVRSRPVFDSHNNPVENSEAVAMREALLDKIGAIKVPDGPLELILDAFGVKDTAEVTGRRRRVVRVIKNGEEKMVVESRSRAKADADADAFMADKKKVLIFSDAGGTGRSYHADLTAKNQRKRIHYLVQPGWRADRAVQGFGRSHRSNQKQAPHYNLVTTDIKGQKRFISSIARRLDQLGALTGGQRQTGSGGIFQARDNLESQYASDALEQFFTDLVRNRSVGDIDLQDFQDQTGLRIVDEHGQILRDLPPIRQFLNRLLSMNIDAQNDVFEAFSEKLDSIVEREAQAGTLDVGLETLKADKIDKVHEDIIYTDPKSGAETKYVEIETTHKTPIFDYKKASDWDNTGFWQNVKSGKIWVSSALRTKTDKYGNVNDYHTLRSVGYTQQTVSPEILKDEEHWKKLTPSESKQIWDEEIKTTSPTYKKTEHIISGAILPVWDRLETSNKVYRLQTSDGERILGMVIDPKSIKTVLKNFGASARAIDYKIEDVPKMILNQNYGVYLANGWKIKRSKVSGDNRIEIVGPGYYDMNELRDYGVFSERVNYDTRFFIPTDESGVDTLKSIIQYKPISELLPPAVTDRSAAAASVSEAIEKAKTEQYSLRGGPPDKPTLEAAKEIFKGQEVYQSPEGNIIVKTRGGQYLEIKEVESITPNDLALTVAYGRTLKGRERIVGKYQDDKIELVRNKANQWVAVHEVQHWMEDAGIINSVDVAALRGHIKRKIKEGSFKTRNAEDPGGAEDRANFIANELTAPKAKGAIKRIIDRIRDFIDKIVNLFGKRTAKGIVRDIKSGEIFERQGDWRKSGEPDYQKTADTWFSQMRNVLDKKLPGKSKPEMVRDLVKSWAEKGEFKADELKWSGLTDYLTEKGDAVTKQEVLDFLDQNRVEVREVMKGSTGAKIEVTDAQFKEMVDALIDTGPGWNRVSAESNVRNALNGDPGAIGNMEFSFQDRDDLLDLIHQGQELFKEGGPPKFANWQIPGGKDYRELLLTLPTSGRLRELDDALQEGRARPEDREERLRLERDSFRSSHWSEPNPLAHVRFDSRVDSEGNKVLFLQEVQSDWALEGRRKGFVGNLPEGFTVEKFQPELGPEKWQVLSSDGRQIYSDTTREKAIEGYGRLNANIPPAPFVKGTGWMELSLKKMLRYAAENGYDKVSWASGEKVAELYDLSKHFDSIRATKVGNSDYYIRGITVDGQSREFGNFTESKLSDIVGKDLADNIVKDTNPNNIPIEDIDFSKEYSGLDLKVGGEWAVNLYDKMIPAFLNKYGKKWGARVEDAKFLLNPADGGYTPIRGAEYSNFQSIPITDSMKQAVLYEGQPMFAKEEKPGIVPPMTSKKGPGDIPPKETPMPVGGIYKDTLLEDYGTKDFQHNVLSNEFGEVKNYKELWVTYKGKIEENWEDGHSEYSNIKNPVARIRFTLRGMGDDLIIEEIQGPQNKSKIPSNLRNNTYDLAIKHLVSYAIKNDLNSIVVPNADTIQVGHGWETGDLSHLYDKVIPSLLKKYFGDPELTTYGSAGEHTYWTVYGEDPLPNLPTPPGEGGEVKSPQQLKDAWNKYDETGEYTIRDLVDEVDRITSEYPEKMEKLADEVERFKEELRDDLELGGRGDLDAAEERFANAVQKALRRSTPQYSIEEPELPKGLEDFLKALDEGKVIGEEAAADLFQDLAKDEKALKTAGLDRKQISLLRTMVDIPHWISKDYPEIKTFVRREVKRQGDREHLIHDFMASPTKKRAGEIHEFIDLPNKKAEDLDQRALVPSDAQNRIMPKAELEKMGFDEPQIVAYYAYKRSMDKAWNRIVSNAQDMILKPFRDKPWFDLLTDVAKEKITFDEALSTLKTQEEKDAFTSAVKKTEAPQSRLKELRSEIKKIKFYRPRVREQGEYVVRVHNEDGKIIHSERTKESVFQTRESREADRIVERLEKQYPGMRVDKKFEQKTSEEVYQRLSDVAIERFVMKAKERVKTKGDVGLEEVDAVTDAFLEAIADELKARGFGRHAIHRVGGKKNVIGGYKTTGGKDIFYNYITGMAGIITKQDAAFDFYQELSNLNKMNIPNRNYNYAAQYVEDMLRNTGKLDMIGGKLRALAFSWYLMGNMKSAAVQFSQNYVTGIPILAGEMKNLTRAAYTYQKAMKGVARGKMTAEEKKALTSLIDRGVTTDQYIREIKGRMMNRLGSGYYKLIDFLSLPFSGMEIYNRKSAALAMFRWTRKNGATFDEALEKAETFVYDTHYLMGKANLPEWARGKTAANMLARTGYTFRSFNHNYVLSMVNAFRAAGLKTGSKVFGASMAFLMAFGGILALPFLDDILDVLERTTGEPYRARLKHTLRRMGGPVLERLGLAGIPGLLGVDISGSLKLGIPFVGTGANEFFGVFGGLYQKGVRMFESIDNQEYLRALESGSPMMIENVLKAGRMAKGATTPGGKTMFSAEGEPLKLTIPEAGGQFFGFRPARIAAESMERRSFKNMQAYFTRKRNYIYEQARLAEYKDWKWPRVERLIEQYNKKAERHKGIIPQIDNASVDRAIQSAPDEKYMGFATQQ